VFLFANCRVWWKELKINEALVHVCIQLNLLLLSVSAHVVSPILSKLMNKGPKEFIFMAKLD
jgi:hypothetical protein